VGFLDMNYLNTQPLEKAQNREKSDKH
jgi:hypothetical protein